MKYLILIALFLIFNPGVAYAVSPIPTSAASPTSEALNTKLNNQINQLKDKIASRVSELNLVEKRGIIGTVTDLSSTQITLTDEDGNSRIIDVDEITKFSSTAKTSFGLSDLTKGNKISVLGLYNKQSRRILARFIRTSVDPVFLTGVVSEIDSKNIMLTVVSGDKKKTKIDIIQTTTKISDYTKEDELTKSLFSRLAIGDRVSLIGYPDKKDPTLIIASRIIVFADSPKDPKISIEIPTPTKAVSPTTSAPAIRRTTPTPTR